MGINIKIAELRKMKNVSQQELGDYLGVTFQSVSKWETRKALPDIELLPLIAKYFQVSVDEVLGLKPIKSAPYEPRDTDNRNNWVDKDSIFKNRQFFWNADYLRFLVQEVWKLDEPIDVAEIRCGNGELGKLLMGLLPEGSTYTGIDSKFFIEKAKENMGRENYVTSFIESDIYDLKAANKYNLCICQANLRHMNKPLDILQIMKNAVKENGLVVCIELNREIENVGLYINGMDYGELCTSFDWHKLWLKELEAEGRDYAVGMRIPFYMKQIGLKSVDVRMNDKITFITPESEDYIKACEDFASFRGYNFCFEGEGAEQTIKFFMSRGYTRDEMEKYCLSHNKITNYLSHNMGRLSFLMIFGFLITYGRKK